MTKDEFIDGYLSRSGLQQYRTPDGYLIPGVPERIALPCECGEDCCEGWQMVNKETFLADVATGCTFVYHLPKDYFDEVQQIEGVQ